MADSLLTETFLQLVSLFTRQEFYFSVLRTLMHAVIGLSMALVLVLPAITLSLLRKSEYAIGTASVVLNAIPALSWILLLVAAFGVFSPLPVVLTVCLTVLPILLPLAVGSSRVLLSHLLELARLVNPPLGRLLRLVILPAYAPLILSHVRAGIGFAVKMAMVAEAFTATGGIGSRMMLAYSLGNVPQLAALSVVAVMLAVGADAVRRLGARWRWSL